MHSLCRYTQRGEPVPEDLRAQIQAMTSGQLTYSISNVVLHSLMLAGKPVPITDPKALMNAALRAVAVQKMDGVGLKAAQTLQVLCKNAYEVCCARDGCIET
jgi:hypothetical protein